MFLNVLRGQQGSHALREHATSAEDTQVPMHIGPDAQLIADCCSLTGQISDLLSGIDRVAEDLEGEQDRHQAALCKADELAFKLMERIAVTPAVTLCGVRSKHGAADFLLGVDWYYEPSPTRDALLLSFVCDAARLRYPRMPDGDEYARECTEATATVIIGSNACLALIKELASAFAQKDQNDALGQADPDDLDTYILAVEERKRAAIKALIGAHATCPSAVHAKRLVLRRMLEAGDGDAHHLQVEFARSYLGDLNALIQANAQEHEPSSGYSSIWNTFSSKFRWLTSTVHHG